MWDILPSYKLWDNSAAGLFFYTSGKCDCRIVTSVGRTLIPNGKVKVVVVSQKCISVSYKFTSAQFLLHYTQIQPITLKINPHKS